MPEMLTKHPDVVLKILKDAHIKCATGETQKILTTCPLDKFCSLPSGELCIYGIKDISQMSQISYFDILFTSHPLLAFSSLAIMIFLLGILAGKKM